MYISCYVVIKLHKFSNSNIKSLPDKIFEYFAIYIFQLADTKFTDCSGENARTISRIV